MDKTVWIVFEGIDGSGKTTQAKMLNEYLCKKGIKSVYKHIFDSEAGKMLRNIFINNSFSNTVEILLLCATRQSFLDEIKKIEKDYDVIILDRYFLSIFAMQGKEEKDIELIKYLKNIICKQEEKIYTFFINTEPVECKNRLANKNKCDRIERNGVEFHTAVYNRYLGLLKKENNVTMFNGEASIVTLHQDITHKVSSIIAYT